jgi:hypothetical protein
MEPRSGLLDRNINRGTPTLSKLGVVAASFFAIAAPAEASSHNEVTAWSRFFGPTPVDQGGDIPSYVSAVAAANESGALVAIEGTCVSACTVKLAAKNRCVVADAVLWFHAANEGSAASPTGNAVLIESYPPRIRSEVLRRHMLDDAAFDPEHTLTGRELIALGEKECGLHAPNRFRGARARGDAISAKGRSVESGTLR